MGNICSKTPVKEEPLPRCDGRTTNGFWSSTAHSIIGGVIGWFSSSAAEKFDRAVGYDKDIGNFYTKMFKDIFGFDWETLKHWIMIGTIAVGVILAFILFGEFLMPLLPYIEDAFEAVLKLVLYLLGFVWRTVIVVLSSVSSNFVPSGPGTPDWILPLFLGVLVISFFGLYFTDAGQRGIGGVIFTLLGCDIGTNPIEHTGKDNNIIQKFGHLISTLVKYFLAFFGYSFSLVSKDLGHWLTNLGHTFSDINDFIWGYRENIHCDTRNLKKPGDEDVGDTPNAPTCRVFP